MPALTANLLTGFLGSGKTTLLRRLLRSPRLADSAVLINELGEVGLDHLLVEAVDEEVVLLPSGCVCCSIRGELKEALLRLLARRHRGEIPPFSRVVIETTGLAEPAPLVATLTADPMLRWQLRLGAIVTVVDAVHGAGTLDRFAEAVHQVAVADRLVLSKTDLVAPARAAVLAARLRTINPTATLTPSSVGDAALAALVVADLHDPDSRATEVRHWLATVEPDEAGHTLHRPDVRAHLLATDEPVDWAAFGLWLAMLLNRHGDHILRVKGLLRVAGLDQPVVVHGVQHLVHEPQHLAAWPPGLTPATRLVVIGRELDPDLLQRSFSAFLRAGQTQPAPA